MHYRAAYPTNEHERAARRLVEFFSAVPVAEAVLLVCSCARGRASRDSCLDAAVLVRPEVFPQEKDALEQQWNAFCESDDAFASLRQVGKFSGVDLDFIDGCFVPQKRGPTGGPDGFELAIGNYVAYSAPLWERGDLFRRLKERWLPYYDEWLRERRLAMVRHYCLNNLDHIPLYVERGLHFQAFNRLYDAHREFLQALFIARRTYPIAYDKWIQEQIVDILEMPALYRTLVRLFEIEHLESDEIARKAEVLRGLVAQYAV